MPASPPMSPTIAALRHSLRRSERAAVETVWQAAHATGTPLIEPIRGDDRHVLVTFLWRGTAQNVVAVGAALPVAPAANNLRQLPGSDLWFKTYRLPADLRFSYRLAANDPQASRRSLAAAQAAGRLGMGEPDPLNPHALRMQIADRSFAVSVAALPAAPPQPWSEPRPDIPRGTVERHTLASSRLGNDRPVWLYTPPGAAAAEEPYGLLILSDGEAYSSSLPTATILDNLFAEGRIPPLVAVLVGCIDMPTRMRELACHTPFVDFLADELVPWVRERAPVTTDPARTIIGGVSLGGLTAAFAALRHPDRFGNVLSQSGSFWWSTAVPEWLTREFVRTPRLPLRFFLETGLLENSPLTISLLQANRHLRDVLEAKGYAVQYAERMGHHDMAWWRGSLADGIQALAGGLDDESTHVSGVPQPDGVRR